MLVKVGQIAQRSSDSGQLHIDVIEIALQFEIADLGPIVWILICISYFQTKYM